MYNYKNFGNILREIRLSKNMSQEQFADNIVNIKYYGKIERSECSPTLKILFKICNMYNITLTEIDEMFRNNTNR